jgi:hypothetical protein
VGSKQEETLRNNIGNIKSTIAKLRGGTALTEQELALIETYTPTIDDSPLQIESKLSSLGEFIKKKRESLLRVAGGDYTPVVANAPGAKTANRFEILSVK